MKSMRDALVRIVHPYKLLYTIKFQQPEYSLLDQEYIEEEHVIEKHDISTAPLITRDAYVSGGYPDAASQYGVIGRILSTQGWQITHGLCYVGEYAYPSLPVNSEAAWLAVPNNPNIARPEVHVYVSRSFLKTMRAVYEPLGSHVIVQPLIFSESELDAQAFLSMMAVGSSDSAPLYMQIVLTILRELGENYTYQTFVKELERRKEKFNPAQLAGLEQRMSLLTSFTAKDTKPAPGRGSRFSAGRLTIIDLSDPFIDPVSACGLFEIMTRLFIRADLDTGKFLLVDEAHKYLSASKSSGLTNALLALTRQQRHLSMRVIISTQEPTVVPPVLLDLCTVFVLHRFSSPSWWEHLIKHVSADFTASDAFDKVVRLQTGQAIVLAPSALGVFNTSEASESGNRLLSRFGRRYLIMKTRKRVTKDGGASVLVLGG
ncbi:hypothetical protein H0H81_006110 [Sphagnurus paluster]|uniref:Zona occludens toxin N-terminal domain-containing protein n=1 Tax=Sphagnurus paluster TaxID=117069 RepID=A0A9P7FTJ1_9AGAR|nr:hypothetical protein H0H81_006110 [Sphagnurus paluster]